MWCREPRFGVDLRCMWYRETRFGEDLPVNTVAIAYGESVDKRDN
jgi:hypothetical protein